MRLVHVGGDIIVTLVHYRSNREAALLLVLKRLRVGHFVIIIVLAAAAVPVVD